jgi:hypothetical protein
MVIGAWALAGHGIPRMTADIDIFIKPTRINAGRTRRALIDSGFEVARDASIELFLKKKVLIRDYIVQTDIHPFAKGINYRTAWKNKIETELFGVKVFVPSIDDLIAMKKAAGRPKDKWDLRQLKQIRRKKIK